MIRAGDLEADAGALDADAAAAILARRAHALSTPPIAATGTERLLRWTLGGVAFASRLDEIWEAMPPVRITPVPLAEAALVGLFSRRGVVHNLFDPSAALGLPPRPPGPAPMLVLRHPQPRLALAVDALDDLVELAAAALPAPGAALSTVVAAGTARVTVVDGALLIARLLGQTPVEG